MKNLKNIFSTKKYFSEEKLYPVPKAFWTLRRILVLSYMIIFVALAVSVFYLFDGYKNFSVETFRKASADSLKFLVAERLGHRYLGRLNPVADDFARNPETVKAVEKSEEQKLNTLMQVLFQHVQELNIDLKSVSIYDSNLTPVTSFGTTESIQSLGPFFEALKTRTRQQKRKNIGILWKNNEGAPLHTILVPIGGFRVKGFVEMVTNPLFTLKGLGSVLGGQLQILDDDGDLLFMDGELKGSNQVEAILANVVDTEMVTFPASTGGIWTTIAFTRDVSDFVKETTELQNRAFVIVSAIIGGGAILAWLLFQFSLYTRIRSFSNAMVQISQGNTDASIPPTGPDEMRVMAHSLARLREAVHEVEASEKRLRALLEASPVGVVIMRTSDGEVLFANSRVAQLYGAEEKNITKQDVDRFNISPQTNDILAKMIDDQGEVHDYEMLSQKDDGNNFWALVTLKPIEYQDESAVIVWVYDISERVEAEEALRKRISVDELLAQTSRHYIDMDVHKATKSNLQLIGEFIDSDRCYIYRLDDKMNLMTEGYRWSQNDAYLTSEVSQIWSPWLQSKLSKGNPIILSDIKYLSKEAKKTKKIFEEQSIRSVLILPLLHGRQVIGFIGLDTVDRKKEWDEEDFQFVKLVSEIIAIGLSRGDAQTELARKTNVLELTLESMQEGIMVVDHQDHLSNWNDNFLYLMNIPKSKVDENLSINKILDYVQSSLKFNQKNIEDHNDQIANFHNDPIIKRAELSKKDGHTYEYQISPMTGGGMVATYRDITESKKIEKMKNEFVSTVSHELRTPLTSIRGSLGLISGGAIGDMPEKATDLINIAVNNCDRLISLINDILDMEKIESGKMDFHYEEQLLAPLVNQAIVENDSFAQKFNVKYEIMGDVPDVWVNVDRNRLIQVITNLLSNAAKFSPENESVEVSVETVNKMVRVAIRDKGPGIAKEFRSQIFGKFAQADSSDTRKKGGTGLGLSIAKTIVETMGGRIGFKTKMKEGTVFYFDIPQHKIQESHLIEQGSDSDKKSALLLYKNKSLVTKIKKILDQEKINLKAVKTMKEVEKTLSEDSFSTLLIDISHLKNNGEKTLHEIKDKKDIPIILISSDDKQIDVGSAEVVDWITQKHDEKRILKTVKKYISKDKPLKILHIEDDLDNAHVVKLLLEKMADLTLAKTLQEASKIIKNNSFDLVILDIQLPDGSGIELLPILNDKNIPVLVFSAKELENKFYDQVAGYLVKANTTKDQLIKKISKLTKKKM